MNRRAFIGLLTAPMIVRATSLDALPRGVALYEGPHTYSFQGIGGFNNHIRIMHCWFDGEALKARTNPQTEFYQTVRA